MKNYGCSHKICPDACCFIFFASDKTREEAICTLPKIIHCTIWEKREKTAEHKMQWLAGSSTPPANLANKRSLIIGPLYSKYSTWVSAQQTLSLSWIRHSPSGLLEGFGKRQMFTRSAWPAAFVWSTHSTEALADISTQCHRACLHRLCHAEHNCALPNLSFEL